MFRYIVLISLFKANNQCVCFSHQMVLSSRAAHCGGDSTLAQAVQQNKQTVLVPAIQLVKRP